MSKREKIVFSSHVMVAHAWAQQTQSEGRASDGRMYFNGPDLFSYGSHFILGHIMPDDTALLNSSSYSVSTGKHKSHARHSVSHRTILYVPDLTALCRTGFFSADKKRAPKLLREFLEGKGADISNEAAAYLLNHAGNKSPAKAWAAIRTGNETRAKRQKAERAKHEKAELLSYGARAAKLSDKERIAGLASIFKGHNIQSEAKKLYHVHRTLKAAKRENQAEKVWTILLCVRAEIKRREKAEEHKRANNQLAHAVNTVRGITENLESCLKNNDAITAYTARCYADAFDTIASSPRVRVYPGLRDKCVKAALGFAAIAKTARELEAARERARNTENIAAWYRGKRMGYIRFDAEGGGAALRIVGEELQTSHGAQVPLAHAIRAFRFIKLCKERGAAWHRNGHSLRVGLFTIDSVQSNGDFKAGCHDVKWAEVERVAKLAGIFDQAPSDEALAPSHAAA